MGKSTGFLEYERVEEVASNPLERIKNFNEFHRYPAYPHHAGIHTAHLRGRPPVRHRNRRRYRRHHYPAALRLPLNFHNMQFPCIS